MILRYHPLFSSDGEKLYQAIAVCTFYEFVFFSIFVVLEDIMWSKHLLHLRLALVEVKLHGIQKDNVV